MSDFEGNIGRLVDFNLLTLKKQTGILKTYCLPLKQWNDHMQKGCRIFQIEDGLINKAYSLPSLRETFSILTSFTLQRLSLCEIFGIIDPEKSEGKGKRSNKSFPKIIFRFERHAVAEQHLRSMTKPRYQ